MVKTLAIGSVLLVGGVVAGCRHAPGAQEEVGGRSSFAFVDPPPARPPANAGESIAPIERAQYREAQLREPAPLPAYPPAALKARTRLATTVGVRITVAMDGTVAAVNSSLLVFSTPGPFAGAFRDAVEAAVRRWRFTPARVEHYEVVAEGGFTFNRVTRPEEIETEFDLAFTFTTDGKVERR